MKKNFLFLLLSAFLIVSCGSGSGDPVETTKEFMKRVENFEFKSARELITPDYIPYIERIEKAAGNMTDAEKAKKKARTADYTLDYTLASKTDTTAEVNVLVKESKNDIQVRFTLKKRSNKWLIESHVDGY